MNRAIFDRLSGTHITIIVCAAILAPSALYGAVTYSNVAIVNPATGTAAVVDNRGHLNVVDYYGEYASNPLNQIDILVSNTGTTCETLAEWPVPNGKAFIITAMSGYKYQYSSSSNYAGVLLWSGSNCSGHLLTTHYDSVSQTSPAAPVAVQYGSGIPVAAGSTVSIYSNNNNGFTSLHGYLVPAAWVRETQYGATPAASARVKLGPRTH